MFDSFPFLGLKKAQTSNTKKNTIFKKLFKKENHIYHSRKMLSGTSTDSLNLSCSRATTLEQEKTSSQSLCQKAYFPAYDSNSYSLPLNKSSVLTFLPGLCTIREEPLWSIEDIHPYRELCLHEWPQLILQQRHDILQTFYHVSITPHQLKNNSYISFL